jgi:5-formaminoimidazole-4-carboxamide-1-beta-D-ribofuranosyl 5'-monophosphate synthetase
MGDNQMSIETIKIDDIEYVRKDSMVQGANQLDGLDYVIIRTYSAGVHAGYLKRKEGKEVELIKARRFYQWYGSATLSQFAQSGTSQPSKCKFPEEVDRLVLTEAIEVLYVTQVAKATIDKVPVWKS